MLAMFLHMVFKGKKWKMAKKIQGKTYHTQKSLYVKNQQFLCKILENIKKAYCCCSENLLNLKRYNPKKQKIRPRILPITANTASTATTAENTN